MLRRSFRCLLLSGLAILAALSSQDARADVKLSRIFGSNMVLQRDMPIPLWGWADAGEEVTVSMDGASATATPGADGRWKISLPAKPAGGPYTVTIQGKNSLSLENVLMGEVWICSGQSNMAWSVSQSDDGDLETLTAKFPNIRLISVPQVGVQEPQNDFAGDGWQVCSPQTVGGFSGVGYFFGRQIHQTIGVPVGLIDNAWGGSACEAWIRRDLMEADEKYHPLLQRWKETEQQYEQAAAGDSEDAKKQAQTLRGQLAGNHRPSNIYCGVLHPTIGYGIRGAIWYQGESNAGRAYQYRHLFPLMIKSWRDEWGQGDFPFYFVQLADFMDESAEPQDSAWAELREAQTMTLNVLPNVGQAVITDLGEAHDIHPKDKQNVAKRLARWALAKDYGLSLTHQSPRYRSVEFQGGKAIVKFDHVGGGMDLFDVRTPLGFTIAAGDHRFVNAQAKVVDRETIEVWSDQVKEPASVRYAWSNNPVCNVQNADGLPLTPFRTDDWAGVTANSVR